MKKFIPALLMLLLVLCPISRTALAQQQLTDATVVKIKTDIARRFRDGKPNVTLRLQNGSKLTGRITEAAENMFSLKEKITGTRRDISYADVTVKQRCKVRYTHLDYCGRSHNWSSNQSEAFRSF